MPQNSFFDARHKNCEIRAFLQVRQFAQFFAFLWGSEGGGCIRELFFEAVRPHWYPLLKNDLKFITWGRSDVGGEGGAMWVLVGWEMGMK